jgi:uncharacterized protein (DUF362 family)
MAMHSDSRRSFLKTSMLGGAAALAATKLGGVAKAAGVVPMAPAVNPVSRVSLAAGDDRANIAFKSLEPFKREIAAAIGTKQVVLKPNNVIINVPLCATHAQNLEGIIEFLHSIGKTNIVIAESPANGSAMEGFANYGYDKLAAKYKVKLVNLDEQPFEVVQCIDQKDFQPHDVRVAKMMKDPANYFVISAAKLKTHDLVGITLSLKNVIVGSGIKDSGAGLGRPGGGGGRSDKPLMHGGGTYGINYNLFALAPVLHPHLAVIDGYEGMEGTGPVNGTAISQKVCVASLDWLAADRVGAALMGVDFEKIGYLSYCARSGKFGQGGDLSKIEIVGPPIKDYAKTYQLPRQWEQITSWQKPVATA